MSYINNISDEVLNQLIPEEMPPHFKKFVIYHAGGYSIEMISYITRYQPVTIRKALHSAKDLIVVGSLNELRLTISNRLICFNLRG